MIERIAHRGASCEFPENTMPAFRRALELGAEGIEMDVHATRDGVVVVHHDPQVRIGGTDSEALTPIAALDLADLAAIEIAPGIGVPTLGDALTLVGDRASVYVEIKGRDIEEAVASVIRTSGVSCAVHSFDHAAIERLSRLAPEIPRGLLFEEYPMDPAGAMRVAAARDLWPHWSIVDARLVERVHDVGGRVVAWTVNARPDAEALASMGVDALCGDDVRILPVSRPLD